MTTTTRTLAPITITDTAELRGRLSLSEQIETFEATTNAKLTDEQRHRFHAAQPYKDGDLAKLHDAGTITMMPQGNRVLLRAILQEDASILSLAGELAGHAIEYDARTCIVHEVVAIGGGVKKHLDDAGIPEDDRPQVGDHVFVLSTVADRASKTSKAVRLWTVSVDDISLRWRAPA
jgi:hypothetical protein